MDKFPTPKVVISRCLGFDHCRWDGGIIDCPVVSRIKPYIEVITVCPEVEIGLSTPRTPINVYMIDKEPRLIQPTKNLDLTERMEGFSQYFLNNLSEVDGFILKSRSPLCGYKTTKVYHDNDVCAGSGLFARAVEKIFPNRPIIDEEKIQEKERFNHFLIQIYTWARFRKAKEDLVSLSTFHKNNKLLLLAYNREKLRKLDQLFSRGDTLDYKEYERVLGDIIKKKPQKQCDYYTLVYGANLLSDIVWKTD